jgi:Protein of unknown function (DUF2939)
MSTRWTTTPKTPVLGAFVLLLAFYLLAPGFALLRIDRAVRRGDTATLARLVDFPSVRHGLADEVAGGLLGARPHALRPPSGLPPFGFSFASQIADRDIADRLTPRALIHLIGAGGSADAPRPHARLAGIWFEGPRRMIARVRVNGVAQPLRLRMRLERGGWKLDRVWVPPSLLRLAAADAGQADPQPEPRP